MRGVRLSMDVAIDLILRSGPSLIAIDGLPCSGKSTLAERLRDLIGAECLALDEFVLPEQAWPKPMKPAFPFPYIRYAYFLEAVRALAATGSCAFKPYDWSTGREASAVRVVTRAGPVVVEGVSVLHPLLSPLYDLRVFVDSDPATLLDAAMRRGVGSWERAWREVFLPSVDLYLTTEPQRRADLIVLGRGAG